MARILFVECSNVTWLGKPILDSHAQGFVNSLCDLGNRVLALVGNGMTIGFLYNDLRWAFFEKNQIKRVIKSFKPELIISYNNYLPDGIIQSSSCPVLVYPADIVSSWAGLEMIHDHLDRYYFLETTSIITKQIKNELLDISDNRIIPFGHATGVKNIKINQDVNISFVGSILNYSYNIINYFAGLGRISDENKKNSIHSSFCEEFSKYYEGEVKSFDFSLFRDNYLRKIQGYEASCLAFCNKRFEVLSMLSDLGLKIYGWPASWSGVMMYNFNIWKCFDYHTSVTLEDSIDTYNRSIVSLNLPQGSNTDGFSWRVTDILASNAVLLSDKKKDLVALMAPYYKEMPYYESALEARTMACRLLNEANWRKEIVEASNAMVDENCRFEKKIRVIAEAFPEIALMNRNRGEVTYLSAADVCKPMSQVERWMSRFPILKNGLKQIYNRTYTNKIIMMKEKAKYK